MVYESSLSAYFLRVSYFTRAERSWAASFPPDSILRTLLYIIIRREQEKKVPALRQIYIPENPRPELCRLLHRWNSHREMYCAGNWDKLKNSTRMESHLISLLNLAR